MSGLLIRLVMFFSLALLVIFVWCMLLLKFPLWFVIVLVTLFGIVLALIASVLLERLLPWHVRCCVRAEARRAEMYQGW